MVVFVVRIKLSEAEKLGNKYSMYEGMPLCTTAVMFFWSVRSAAWEQAQVQGGGESSLVTATVL